MSTMQEWLCYLAYAVAVVLALVGARRLAGGARLGRWMDGRRGVFLAAVGFFLLFHGVPDAEAADTERTASPGVAEADKTSAPNKAGPAAAPAVAPSAKAAPFPIPPELVKEGKWDAFRAFWKRLNAVAPRPMEKVAATGRTPDAADTQPAEPVIPEEGITRMKIHPSRIRISTDGSDFLEVPPFDKRPYYRALSPEASLAFLRELAGIYDTALPAFEKMPSGNASKKIDNMHLQMLLDRQGISRELAERGASLPGLMLAILSEQRIRGIATPSTMPMYTRMARMDHISSMDSPSAAQFQALDRLEMRIDTLLELREKKALNAEALEATLKNIEEDAYVALMLDAFRQHHFMYESISASEVARRFSVASHAYPPRIPPESSLWEPALKVYQEQERARLEKLAAPQENGSDSPSPQQSARAASPDQIAKQIAHMDTRVEALRARLAELRKERAAFGALLRALDAE